MIYFVKHRFSIFPLFAITAILLLHPTNIIAQNINESAAEIVKDIWDKRLKFIQTDEPIGVIPLQSSKPELLSAGRIFFSLIKAQLESVYNLNLVTPENLADLKIPFDYRGHLDQQAKRVGKLLGCKAFITGQIEDIGASLNVNLFVWNATTGTISYVADTQLRKDAALTALLQPYIGGRLEPYALKWRGDIAADNVHAITVGDVNGDGQNELILATDDKLKVLAWKWIRFWDTSLKNFTYLHKPHQLKSGQRNIRTLYMADLDGNDRDEIYLSIPPAKTHRVEWQDNSPKAVELSRKYMFLHVGSNGITGSRFLEYRGCFSGEQTARLAVRKGAINAAEKQAIASDYNSLNIGSTDDDDEPEVVVVDHLGHVKIFTQSATQLNLVYQSNPIFGVGLAIIDLDGNGINEIVCSAGTYESSVHGVNRPFQDNIFVLEWDGDTYSKKWKSQTFEGSITDFTAADVDNDDILELVVCVRTRIGIEIRLYAANK